MMLVIEILSRQKQNPIYSAYALPRFLMTDDERGQGISSHFIDLVIGEYSDFRSVQKRCFGDFNDPNDLSYVLNELNWC